MKTKRQIQEEKWEKQDKASFRRWVKRVHKREKWEKDDKEFWGNFKKRSNNES